MHGLWQLVNWR
uniref:Uncharacterized protein n=1 Tax=Arundo donax TaxID=35708 RepID=A0A0A8ZFN6_ARUDO